MSAPRRATAAGMSAEAREALPVFAGLMLALVPWRWTRTSSRPLCRVSSAISVDWRASVVGRKMPSGRKSTMTTPIWRKLSDIRAQACLLCSITIFFAGSALCGLFRTMTELIVFRAVQGLGAGGLITLSQSSLATWFRHGNGAVSGLVRWRVAACRLRVIVWGATRCPHWIFYVNLPVGAVAIG